MIYKYQLQLKQEDGKPIPIFWAYRFYAWILQQIPCDVAEYFHQQQKRAISQYLDHGCWTVNLLGQDAVETFGSALEKTKEIVLHSERILVSDCSCEVVSAENFLQRGQEIRSRRAELLICSPTAFKQAGRYAIFPTEQLLIQSLVMRWNELFPQYNLEDSDVMEMMCQGVHIVDYNLHTAKYHLKDTMIPGFCGKLYVEAQLPTVVHELWNSLLCLAPYCGIGIKTTLGMGGVKAPSHSLENVHVSV